MLIGIFESPESRGSNYYDVGPTSLSRYDLGGQSLTIAGISLILAGAFWGNPLRLPGGGCGIRVTTRGVGRGCLFLGKISI